MLKVFEFLKISLGDLLETLGLVMTRPWKMSAAVLTGGDVLENALMYYFVLLSASALIALYPLNLGAEFAGYTQSVLVTSFLVLAVTSVVLFCGWRLVGVPISFKKVLTIKAFIAGAYVLANATILALATSLIAIIIPEEKQVFAALTLGCIPLFDFTSGAPAIVAPLFGFLVHVLLSLLSFSYGLYLFCGAYAGVAPFKSTSWLVFCITGMLVFILDFILSAAFAGLNFNGTSAYCIAARQATGL